MIPTDRFDRHLPVLLDELAQPRTPDYFDDLLGLTARTRQRPDWTFPERWIPMLDIAREPVLSRRVPWRPVVVLALITLLVLATLAFYAGTHRVPAPFGPARNGLIGYAKAGEIYTADATAGEAKVVVTSPETDLRPVFSLDGTRIAFERKMSGRVGAGLLFVANADGTGLIQVTPEPLEGINSYTFSPDGREITLSVGSQGATRLLIAKADAPEVRTLPVGDLVAKDPEYRPPNGAEIVFVGTAPGTTATGQYVAGLYAVKPDGSGLRTIVAPTNLQMFGPRSAPDGSQIAFNALGIDPNPEPPGARVYVVDADGGAPRLLRDVAPEDLESVVAWSNDGTRLLISGCYRSEPGVEDCPSTMEVVPVDGNGPVVRIDYAAGFPGADGTSHAWAPDDTAIITTPLDAQGLPMGEALSWDTRSGKSTPVPWTNAGGTSWQRLAR